MATVSKNRTQFYSFHFDVGRADHLAPLFGVIGEQFAEVGGRARKHGSTYVGKRCFHPGIGESGVDFRVEPGDDFGGGVFWGRNVGTTPPPVSPHENPAWR